MTFSKSSHLAAADPVCHLEWHFGCHNLEPPVTPFFVNLGQVVVACGSQLSVRLLPRPHSRHLFPHSCSLPPPPSHTCSCPWKVTKQTHRKDLAPAGDKQPPDAARRGQGARLLWDGHLGHLLPCGTGYLLPTQENWKSPWLPASTWRVGAVAAIWTMKQWMED